MPGIDPVRLVEAIRLFLAGQPTEMKVAIWIALAIPAVRWGLVPLISALKRRS